MKCPLPVVERARLRVRKRARNHQRVSGDRARDATATTANAQPQGPAEYGTYESARELDASIVY